MGKGPGKFADLGKAASNLLNKDFGVGKNTVELKSTTPDALTLTTNGAHKTGGAADASVQAEFKPDDGVTLKGKIDTAGVTSTTLELEGYLMKGLKATLGLATPPLDKPGFVASAPLALDFTAANSSALCSFDPLKGAASASAVSSFGRVAGGASVTYDTSKGLLKAYAAKARYAGPMYSLVGSLAGDPKTGITYGCSYHVAVVSVMEVAAEVGVAPGGKTSVAAVSSWNLDPQSTVKTKVDTTGTISLSYKHKLNPTTSVTVAGSFDVNFDASKTKTGIALNINP